MSTELENKEIIINGPAKVTIETGTELENINNEIEQIDKQLAAMEPTTAEIVEAMKPKTEPFKARKIAIVGFAETSYKLAPWGKPDWEIWGLNGLHKIITWTNNITRWFQIHPKESIFGEGLGGGVDHVKFLQSLKIPVFMTQHYDEIPMSVAYPLKEICEWFSIGREKERHPYLSNTISEMLALLAYEIVIGGREVDEIGVWGVDMAHATEWAYQKNSCEFYLGIFEGYRQIMEVFKRSNIVAGVVEQGVFKELKLPFPRKWHLPKESLLLYGKYVYGYEEVEDEAEYKRLMARRQILINNRNNHLVKEQENHDAQMQFLGAMQEMDNEIKNRGY
jgi:hypothetical protein